MTERERGEVRREEILFERVLSGEGRDRSWSELEGLAGSDPQVWERVARRFRDGLAWSEDVERALEVADHVELPRGGFESDPVPGPMTISRSSGGVSRWAAGLGWVAAVLIAILGWTQGSRTGSDSGGVPSERAVTEAVEMEELPSEGKTPRREVTDEKKSGELVQELPHRIVEARPVDRDSVEILFIRRSLERMVVDQLMEVGRDDLGRPISTPVSHAKLASYGSF